MLGKLPLCVVALAITCWVRDVRANGDSNSNFRDDGVYNVPFNITITAKFVSEILEAMLVYISFRLTLQRSFLQDVQKKICIRSIDRSALAGLIISIIFTVVVSIACFSAKERLRGGLNIYGWPVHSIVRIFLGLLTGFMSLRIPFILGLYHKPILEPRIVEELALHSPILAHGRLHCSIKMIFKKLVAFLCSLVDRFFHYRLGFLVAWTVLREGIMLGMYIASVSGTRQLNALPLSVSVGILIPLSITGLYIFVSRRFLNRKWLGILACGLMGLLGASLFGRGLYVEEDSIFHTPRGINIKLDTGAANGIVMALLAPFGWLHNPTLLQEVGWFTFVGGMVACHVYMFLRYGPRNYSWLPAKWREEKEEAMVMDVSTHKLSAGHPSTNSLSRLLSSPFSVDLSGAGSSRYGRSGPLSGRGMVFSGSRVFARSSSHLRSHPVGAGGVCVREGYYAPRASPRTPQTTGFDGQQYPLRRLSWSGHIDLDAGVSCLLRGEGIGGGAARASSYSRFRPADFDESDGCQHHVGTRDFLNGGDGSACELSACAYRADYPGVERGIGQCSWGGEIRPALEPSLAVGDSVDEVVGVPCWQLTRLGSEVRWNPVRSAAPESPPRCLPRSRSALF
eukprot:jgi/Mesvir1/4940/Mv04565-RA.1